VIACARRHGEEKKDPFHRRTLEQTKKEDERVSEYRLLFFVALGAFGKNEVRIWRLFAI
jgi:hypothetical protein